MSQVHFLFTAVSSLTGEDQKALFISLWGATIMTGLVGGTEEKGPEHLEVLRAKNSLYSAPVSCHFPK